MKRSSYGSKAPASALKQYRRPANWTVNGVNFVEEGKFTGTFATGTAEQAASYYEVVNGLGYYDVENNSTYYGNE